MGAHTTCRTHLRQPDTPLIDNLVGAEYIPPAHPGDLDSDGDVDQKDFGLFQECYSGSGMTYRAGCDTSDMDNDNDVDQEDFSIFLECMDGTNQPPGC